MAFIPEYILILGLTIIIDYFAGIFIENNKDKKRKFFLIISLISNIGVLVIFKYFNFLNYNITSILNNFSYNNPIPYLTILLPVGLSFHTFQAMSYIIEVYRGNQKAERHFGIYSLYVMFYPQLVAGPIERPQNLLYQFREKYNFEYKRVTSGLKLMAWGLFKKVVIADRLALIVDVVYDNPEQHNGLSLIIATFLFTFQIFCDFSGYSDIAIGAARVMGFKLMTNFDKPYRSKTVQEFWKRWHMSLSNWFKDYLYITLGGNRVSIPRWCFNLFVVFLVSGLWHGANWTFIIWGGLHGFYLVFSILTNSIKIKINSLFHFDKIPFLGTISTFSLIAFAWIFFRARNLDNAFYIIKKIFVNIPELLEINFLISSFYEIINISKIEFIFSLFLILFMEFIHFIQSKYNLNKILYGNPFYLRWSIYCFLILTILFFGVFEERQFIYFQF